MAFHLKAGEIRELVRWVSGRRNVRRRNAGEAVGNKVREVQVGVCVMQGLVYHCNVCHFFEGNEDPL